MSTGEHTATRGESLTAVDVLPILIVDDRVENLRAMEAVLEPLGHPILRALSGAEALRVLLERRRPRDRVEIHAFRRDELMRHVVDLAAPPLDTCFLAVQEDADPASAARRQAWLSR